ncbi:MAG TPA: hypothetical protein VFM69_11105 [Pricia sp.]|nr:hypothetical protein [Pricia sp.]
MRKISITTGIAIIFSLFGFSQDNCSKFYPLKEGSSFQYTMYDKKGKPDGMTDYKVVDVSDEGNQTTATMQIQFTDKKGKEVFASDYAFTCTGNGIKIDYNSLIPDTMLEQFKDMEYEITGTDIEVPNDLSVGQSLDDANVAMRISMAGMNMDINVNMINRKVEKRESVTTAAGTFDCFVIYGETESKTMGATHKFPNRLWLAEDIGMVKQETYKENGNVISSMALTTLSLGQS